MSLLPNLDPGDDAIYREPMTRFQGDDIRLELPRVVEAHVRMVGGEVAVTGTSGPPRIEAQVVHGEAVRIEVEAGVLTVVHEPQSWLSGLGSKRTEAVITLAVPADTPVTVRTVSAEVVVAGLQGGTSINTVSGSVTATDLAGELTLRTVSGEVDAQAIDGDATVNTVSGAVTIAGRVSRLTGRAVSGDLTFDLDAAPEASLSTVSGEVLMRLPSDASARLDATTMSGHLDSAFVVSGTSGRRRLSGLVGRDESAPTIDVRTMSGDVALLRNEVATAGSVDGFEDR